MRTTKTTKIIYWITTVIIFLFEGVMQALTSHTRLAVEGIRRLGYPDYFRVMLTVFKGAGALVLILPIVKGRFKEWAYAGFGITIISAFINQGQWMALADKHYSRFSFLQSLPSPTFITINQVIQKNCIVNV
jgi:hypothetical protein